MHSLASVTRMTTLACVVLLYVTVTTVESVDISRVVPVEVELNADHQELLEGLDLESQLILINSFLGLEEDLSAETSAEKSACDDPEILLKKAETVAQKCIKDILLKTQKKQDKNLEKMKKALSTKICTYISKQKLKPPVEQSCKDLLGRERKKMHKLKRKVCARYEDEGTLDEGGAPDEYHAATLPMHLCL